MSTIMPTIQSIKKSFKMVNYGMQVYAPCDSSNGYLLNLDVYCGKGPNMKERVISHKKCLNKGNILNVDNLHNSVTMSWLLLQFDTGTCGKLRGNHGQPEQLHALVRTRERFAQSLMRLRHRLMER